MATDLMRELREVLPTVGRDWREHGALTWLAEGAGKDTGLTWQGYKTLTGLVPCGKNMIGPAIERLAEKGLVSILQRRGRVPLYLVHPKGLSSVSPLTTASVRGHLDKGRFSEGDICAALTWLAGLGVLVPADALALVTGTPKSAKFALSVPTTGTPAHDRSNSQRRSPPEGHRYPRNRDGGVPAMGNEPEENRKKTERAGPRPANPGGLAGATVQPNIALADNRPTKADFDALQADLAARLRTPDARSGRRMAQRARA